MNDYYCKFLYGMLRNLLTEEDFNELLTSSLFPLPESLQMIGKYRFAEINASPDFQI